MDKRTSGVLVAAVSLTALAAAIVVLQPPKFKPTENRERLVAEDGTVNEAQFRSYLAAVKGACMDAPNSTVNTQRLSEFANSLGQSPSGYLYIHRLADALWEGKAPQNLWVQMQYAACVSTGRHSMSQGQPPSTLNDKAYVTYLAEMLSRNPDPTLGHMLLDGFLSGIHGANGQLASLRMIESVVASDKGKAIVRSEEWKVSRMDKPGSMEIPGTQGVFQIEKYRGKPVAVALMCGSPTVVEADRKEVGALAKEMKEYSIEFVTVGKGQNCKNSTGAEFEIKDEEDLVEFGTTNSPKVYVFDKSGLLIGDSPVAPVQNSLQMQEILVKLGGKEPPKSNLGSNGSPEMFFRL